MQNLGDCFLLANLLDNMVMVRHNHKSVQLKLISVFIMAPLIDDGLCQSESCEQFSTLVGDTGDEVNTVCDDWTGHWYEEIALSSGWAPMPNPGSQQEVARVIW